MHNSNAIRKKFMLIEQSRPNRTGLGIPGIPKTQWVNDFQFVSKAETIAAKDSVPIAK